MGWTPPAGCYRSAGFQGPYAGKGLENLVEVKAALREQMGNIANWTEEERAIHIHNSKLVRSYENDIRAGRAQAPAGYSVPSSRRPSPSPTPTPTQPRPTQPSPTQPVAPSPSPTPTQPGAPSPGPNTPSPPNDDGQPLAIDLTPTPTPAPTPAPTPTPEPNPAEEIIDIKISILIQQIQAQRAVADAESNALRSSAASVVAA